MARCIGRKADGSLCEHIVADGAAYCYGHDPERKVERSRNASRAAKAKAGEIHAIKTRLRELAEQVTCGEIDKGRASVAGQLYGVLCRYIEAERKIREQEELVARLDALEAQASRAGGHHRWG